MFSCRERRPIPGGRPGSPLRTRPSTILNQFRVAFLPAVLAGVATLAVGSVLAHDDRETGGYKFVVGFRVEPAYEGLPNGVDVKVTKPVAGDQGSSNQGMQGQAGQSHGQGMAMQSQSHQGMAAAPREEGGAMIDVAAHGAIFSSPAVTEGRTFSFEPGDELEGKAIPYHSHLDHSITGTVTVSSNSSAPAMVEVAIHDSMFMPADVTVAPGGKVVWTSKTATPQSVTSGLAPSAPAAVTEVPVEGLEESLRVEIKHVATGGTRVLDLRAMPEEPGHYTADIIPTAQGVYEMRVFGKVEETGIDETFTSFGGGGGFSDVLPASDLQFPDRLPGVRQIEGAVRGAIDTAEQAQDAALSAQAATATNGGPSANTLGIIGIVLGAIGMIAGAGGLTVAMRKR